MLKRLFIVVIWILLPTVIPYYTGLLCNNLLIHNSTLTQYSIGLWLGGFGILIILSIVIAIFWRLGDYIIYGN